MISMESSPQQSEEMLPVKGRNDQSDWRRHERAAEDVAANSRRDTRRGRHIPSRSGRAAQINHNGPNQI